MSAHSHVHAGHSGHHHGHGPTGSREVITALFVTLGFSLFEAAGAVITHSLALLGDAGHMLFDAVTLGVAAVAYRVARRPPSHRHSYGLARAEIVAALANALLMVGIVIALVIEAVKRLQTPARVDGGAVMIVATVGLMANLVVIYILSRNQPDLNSRAAVLHAVGDLLGSIAAIISGGVIYFSGWLPIDPLLTIVIAILILYSTVMLLREALNVLMDGVPYGLELAVVGRQMASVRGVASVHDLHVWTLSSGVLALSAHVVVQDLGEWDRLLRSTRSMLMDRFGIGHVTLQPEIEGTSERTAKYRSVIPIHPKD